MIHKIPLPDLFACIFALVVADNICAADEDAKRVDVLEEVATKVRKILPASWEVTLTPSADDFSGADEPVMVVRTKLCLLHADGRPSESEGIQDTSGPTRRNPDAIRHGRRVIASYALITRS